MFKFVGVALRLRYIVPATALGGYYTAKSKYEDFRSQLPNTDFLKNIDFDKWTTTLNESTKTISEWLEEANSAVKSSETRTLYLGMPPEKPKILVEKSNPKASSDIKLSQEVKNSTTLKSVGKSDESPNRNEELIAIREELEKLKRENRHLRTVVRGSSGNNQLKRKLNKSLIEIYSEVLDELSGYDSSYKVQDHLPKVVVVGDQSSGKTSVLEMIAGARIFPRGAGEMMTRAPVQVTLSEGPYHVARFKDSSREYDLNKESELSELRKEIEDRMKLSVQGGKTVSNQVISLTIQGPGIQRMVLVDLPGIIGTVTNELAPDTKDCIKKMVTEYMGNPNAIILCIQDGSLDAERSIFTDLVREVDKKGRRTILVLTKVDIAEKTHTNPSKIKKILDGELFPMKALGYYAVVAGKSGHNEDIQDIKNYEEQFFLTSSLCDRGILNPSQCTTRNLSAKVSECFWGMVKASVEQQADAYKATLLNLEAEWNHLFPHIRQLTRDELFYNARNEILDEVAKLTRLSTRHWDQYISSQLWSQVRADIVQRVYFPASKNPLHLARVSIDLKSLVESLELPKLAIKVAQDSVRHQFDKLLEAKRASSESHNSNDVTVYKQLKKAVIHDALSRHQWSNQALDVLRVVQLEALSNQTKLNKQDWADSISFIQTNLQELIESTSKELISLTGYSFTQRWLKWKSITNEQKRNMLIQAELEKLLASTESIDLTQQDFGNVKRNLDAQGIPVSDEDISRLWKPFRNYTLLQSELNRTYECSKEHYAHDNGIDTGIDCTHVAFFWRVKKMLESTTNSLRRQILDNECRRIEREIIEVLEEYGENEDKKVTLLSDKRVELAEELKRVRQIQEKLDEFITALNNSPSK